MIVASYYTPPYKPEVENLVASLARFKLPHFIEEIQSRGSWRLNCGFKPTFLLEMLDVHKQPVLWLDADAVVQREFEQTFLDATEHTDFGAWFIPNRVMRKADVPGGPDSGADGIASGTMLWCPTPAAIGLLLLWQEMDKHDNRPFEQQVLGEAWLRTEKLGGLRTLRLPQRYCKVHDAPWFDEPDDTPIIEHFQASRKYRNLR